MNAIKLARRFIETDPTNESAQILARLVQGGLQRALPALGPRGSNDQTENRDSLPTIC